MNFPRVSPRKELWQESEPLDRNTLIATTLSPRYNMIGAFKLPETSKDAAILTTRSPGPYTAVVTGANGATGVALIEFYAVG